MVVLAAPDTCFAEALARAVAVFLPLLVARADTLLLGVPLVFALVAVAFGRAAAAFGLAVRNVVLREVTVPFARVRPLADVVGIFISEP